MLPLEPLYFSTEKLGPSIFIVQRYPWTRPFFRCLCVSDATVLLRFLLNTATSSRFPTGNKLFLKNPAPVYSLLSFDRLERTGTGPVTCTRIARLRTARRNQSAS